MATKTTKTTAVVARPTRTAADLLQHVDPNSTLGQSLFNIAATFDKADVVAVMTTRREEDLHVQKLDAQHRLDQLTSKGRDLKAAYDAIGPSLIGQIDLTSAKAAAVALTAAGFGQFEARSSFEATDDKTQTYRFSVSIAAVGQTGYNSEKHDRHVTIPFTSEAASLLKQMRDNNNDVQEVHMELVRNKQEVANLPAYARRVHARMVEDTLKSIGSGQGEAMLQSLGGVKALPIG